MFYFLRKGEEGIVGIRYSKEKEQINELDNSHVKLRTYFGERKTRSLILR